MVADILLLGFLSVLLLWIYGLRPIQKWKFRYIPGPRTEWLFGNLQGIIVKGKHEAFRTWAREFGNVFKVFEGGVVSIVIQDPKLARKVNTKNHNRHPIPYMETGEEERFNSKGILFARDAYHRGLRSAWQPMFYSGSLEGFMSVFDSAALQLVENLDAAANTDTVVDIHSMIGDMTMSISSITVFGSKLDDRRAAPGSDAGNLLKASRAFFLAAGDLENIYALMQLIFPPLSRLIRHLATAFPTRNYAAGLAGRQAVRNAVLEMLRQHEKNSGDQDDSYERKALKRGPGEAVAKGSFLDLMARTKNRETGDNLTKIEAVSQAFSFVLAATETSTAAIAFAVHLLAVHTQVQDRVIAEVDRYGRDKRPTYDELKTDFPYLDAVFKETLRLYPPVPMTIREAEKDTVLSNYAIPAGTHLAVNIYGMQRDANYWNDPDDFRPERFIDNMEPFEKDAYMPFGEGTRACIGQKYAWQEAILTLVRIFQCFKVRLANKNQTQLQVHMSLGLAPQNGIKIRCYRR